MIPVCGKFYHGECIANYAPTAPVSRGFRCSIHVCLTCFIANPNSSSISKGKQTLRYFTFGTLHIRIHVCSFFLSLGRLVRCVRCPVAYHATDLCMAAGSVVLSNNSIICPNHFTPRRGVKNHEHVNVSWCFVCTEGTAPGTRGTISAWSEWPAYIKDGSQKEEGYKLNLCWSEGSLNFLREQRKIFWNIRFTNSILFLPFLVTVILYK